MRIAILGATSEIAKDLVLSFSKSSGHDLVLFARRPLVVTEWLTSVELPGRYSVADFEIFNADENFDAIINFVGSGNPAQTLVVGASILDVTSKYDELALEYLRYHQQCRYIFLSSGAAYGSSFNEPVCENSKAVVAINNLQPQDFYALAKLHSECRHRALAQLPIVDIRVFNYFSHTQDMSARFLITDIVRAIKSNTVLEASSDYIVRDFITPPDFCQLIECIIKSEPRNMAVDFYTKAPIDKPTLLKTMHEQFGLQFKITDNSNSVNATGLKPHYYSLNKVGETLGYSPRLSSAEGLLEQTNQFLISKF